MGNATVPGTVGAHCPRLTPARAFLANQAARDTSKSADLAAFAESVRTSHQASSACARANPERSSLMSSIDGTASSLQSKRPRCAAGQRGGDAELQQAWRILGKPGGYDAPGEQELQDLADSRNRKRGEREQKRRLKANWQALERVAAAQPAEPEPTGPAVPPYLLERGMVQPVSSNVPTYIDVKALRARFRPSAARLGLQHGTPLHRS